MNPASFVKNMFLFAVGLFVLGVILMFAVGTSVGLPFMIAAVACAIIGAVRLFSAKPAQNPPTSTNEPPLQAAPVPVQAPEALVAEKTVNAVREEKPFPYEILNYRVAGVSFADEGIDRQYVLRKIHFNDPPFDKGSDVIIQKEAFEGAPAIGVYVVYVGKDERFYALKIGYIPAESVEEVTSRLGRFDRVTTLDIYGGKDYKNWGARVYLRFWKEGIEHEINDLDYAEVCFEKEKGRRFS